MATVKFYIGSELTDFNEVFNVMFSIGDIRDVGFGNSNKSYTLNLPLTKQNKKRLKFISQTDVKSEPSAIGRLYLGELLIIQGTVIVQGTGDYFAKVIINSDDWIDSLKDKRMIELDLSASDHTYTHEHVEETWGSVSPWDYPMYRYPMIDFGALVSAEYGTTAKWRPNDFIPMLSVAQLITKILSLYTISSTFLATAFAKNLFILCKESIRVDDSFTQNKALEVNVAAASDNLETGSSSTSMMVTLDRTVTGASYVVFKTRTTDEGTDFSANTIYTVPETGTYRFIATMTLINTAFENTSLEIDDEQVILSIARNGTDIAITESDDYDATELINGVTYIADTGYYHLTAGDIITVSLMARCYVINISGTQTVTISTAITSNLVNVWDNINKYNGIGKTISLEEMLPDMSQLDFLAAIRDVFNLRFWMDKMRRTIHIEPWDQFLSATVVDLTEFIDFESMKDEPPTELISSNYSKTVRLKWKEDTSDVAFTEYMKYRLIGPDSKDILLTSLFAKNGIDTKEHPFSSVITGYNNAISDNSTPVPRIWNSLPAAPYNMFDRKTGFNTRIVEWKGLTDGFTWYYEDEEKTKYPKIAGLDFATMFANYWQKTYHYIDKGKILPVRIRVKPSFLNQFFTVLTTATSEGFRPTYSITFKGIKNYFFLQKVVSDGETAELELVLKQ